MSNNPPNFNPNNPQGRLVVGRQDFQAHIEGALTPNGANLSHNATAIKVVPPLTVGLNSCANLDEAIRALSDSLVSITFSGDLYGTDSAQTVVGIQTIPVNSTTPTNGQVLTYDADTHQAAWMTSSIDGYPVQSGPVNGDILFFQGGEWNRRAIGSSGQVLTSFSGDPAWVTLPATGYELFNAGVPVDGYTTLGVDGSTITLTYPSGIPTLSGVSLSGTNTWTGTNTFGGGGLQLNSSMYAMNDAIINITAGSSINASTGSEILSEGSTYFQTGSQVSFSGDAYFLSEGSTYFQTGSQVSFYGDAYFLNTVATGSENTNELYGNNIVKAYASIPLANTSQYLVNGGDLQSYVTACNDAGFYPEFFGFNLGACGYDNYDNNQYDAFTFAFTNAFANTNYCILCFIDNGIYADGYKTQVAQEEDINDNFPTTNAAQHPSTSSFVLFSFNEGGALAPMVFSGTAVQSINILVIGAQ